MDEALVEYPGDDADDNERCGYQRRFTRQRSLEACALPWKVLKARRVRVLCSVNCVMLVR
jgi:hypothetical protein